MVLSANCSNIARQPQKRAKGASHGSRCFMAVAARSRDVDFFLTFLWVLSRPSEKQKRESGEIIIFHPPGIILNKEYEGKPSISECNN